MRGLENHSGKALILISIITILSLGVTAQSYSLNEPSDGSTIYVEDSTSTVDVTTSVNLDLSSYTSSDTYSNTYELYVNGTLDGTISEDFTGGTTHTVNYDVLNAEPGTTYTWNHSGSINGDTASTPQYSFSVEVAQTGTSPTSFANYEQVYAQVSTDGNSIRKNEISENYILQGTDGGEMALLDRDTGDVIYSHTDAEGDYTQTATIMEEQGLYAYDDTNQNLIVRNISDGTQEFTYTTPSEINSLDASSQYFGIGGTVGDVYVIDSTGTEQLNSNIGSGNVWSVEIDDQYFVASAENSGTIYYEVFEVPGFGSVGTQSSGLGSDRTYGMAMNDDYIALGGTDTYIFEKNNPATIWKTLTGFSSNGLALNDGQELLRVQPNEITSLEAIDVETENQVKTFLDAQNNNADVGAYDDNGFVARATSSLYLYESPGLSLENLTYGNYNYDTASIEESNSFRENKTWVSRVDYSGGGSGDCIDIFVRPQSGWDPIPPGYNSDEWASFGQVNCLENLDTDFVQTPILDVIDFPLNQSASYEIFAGGFQGSTDPSSLASKNNADVVTQTETFDVTLEGAELDSNISVSEPLDGATYSYENATNGIPWDFTVTGNKENVNISWTGTADNNNSDVVYESGFDGANITGSGFTANGDFTIPDFYHDDGEPFTFTVEVTDGFSTQSSTSSFTLSDTYQAPDDGGTDPGDGDGDTPTDGFLSEFIGTFFGGIADVFDVIDQNAKDSFGSAGIQAISVLLSFGVGFLIFIGSAILEAPSEPLAFLGFVASIGVFTSVGWISPWLIVGSMIAIASLGLWYIFN